ncbi:MAG: SMP-30/gluconolactonase/LRE family protein, partial [Planctomycetota bacterium]
MLRMPAGTVLAAVVVSTVLFDATLGQKIYWTDVSSRTVRRTDATGSNLDIVLESLLGPKSVDIDHAAGKIYWIDDDPFGSTDDSIKRSNLDGTEEETLLSDGVVGPYALALDPVGGKIYFSQVIKLRRCNLDGTGVEDLYETVSTSRSIVVDPDTGMMTWSVGATIYRAAMDGSSTEFEEQIIGDSLSTIYNIKYHRPSGKMYWTSTEFGIGELLRADIDIPLGQTVVNRDDIELLITGGSMFDARGLAIDDSSDLVYWTDRLDDVVRRSNLDGEEVVDLVTIGLVNPSGMALDTDAGKMFWADFSENNIKRTDLSGANVENVITDVLSSPVSVAVDRCTNRLYWADNGTDRIQRSNLAGEEIETLVSGSSTNIQDMAIDTAAEMMYWTDDSSNSILRAAFEIPDGESASNRTDIETLVAGVSQPSGIALDPDAHMIYWADRSSNMIFRAGASIPAGETPDNRTDIEELVAGLSDPWGVALDLQLGRVFWVDSALDRLEWAPVTGGSPTPVITSGLEQGRGVAVDPAEQWVYWTDRTLGSVSRARYDGNDVQTLIENPLEQTWGITLDLCANTMAFTLASHADL